MERNDRLSFNSKLSHVETLLFFGAGRKDKLNNMFSDFSPALA